MSQDPTNPQDEDPVVSANGVPQLDEALADQIGEQVTEDVGGVQGSAADEDAVVSPDATVTTGSPSDQPAPDAGEIEWAGQVVKKPPHPEA